MINNFAYAWFEKCDNQITLTANQVRTITIPDYCAAKQPLDSSRFVITAPQGFSISINCNINMYRVRQLVKQFSVFFEL